MRLGVGLRLRGRLEASRSLGLSVAMTEGGALVAPVRPGVGRGQTSTAGQRLRPRRFVFNLKECTALIVVALSKRIMGRGEGSVFVLQLRSRAAHILLWVDVYGSALRTRAALLV